MSKALRAERQVGEEQAQAAVHHGAQTGAGNAAAADALARGATEGADGLLSWAADQGVAERSPGPSGTCGLFDVVGEELDAA